MELAAKTLNMKIACEIFADRNYEDDGNLVSRSKPKCFNYQTLNEAKRHVLSMVKNQALNCHSQVKRYLVKSTLFVYMVIMIVH